MNLFLHVEKFNTNRPTNYKKKIRNDNNSLHVILQRDCVQSQANDVISYFPP